MTFLQRPETANSEHHHSDMEPGRLRGFVCRYATVLGLILVFGATVSCSSDNKPVVDSEDPVEVLYNNALDRLLDGDAISAAELFDDVERQHPYSVWATRAQLMAAYSHYRTNRYEDAILAAQRFLQLHPGNRDAPYANYLIAISYYEQITDVGRDQQMTERALRSLSEVIARYPESEYARDARLKVDLTRDHLAGKEMEVGRYYMKSLKCVAAIKRFRVVVDQYQTTSHAPEALHRLTECYLSLGVIGEAQTAAAVLGYNYPGSKWYQDSYRLLKGEGLEPIEDSESWLSKSWNSVFN